MSSNFKFKCSSCKAAIITPLYMAGAKTKCSQCGILLQIPDSNTESFQATPARRRAFRTAISVIPLPAGTWDDDWPRRSSCGEDFDDRLSEHERALRKWAMFIHLAHLLNFIFPCSGFVAQILVWQYKHHDLPEIDEHVKNAINWSLSNLLYCLPLLPFPNHPVHLAVVLILSVVFPVIAALNANDDNVWPYPFSIRFLS